LLWITAIRAKKRRGGRQDAGLMNSGPKVVVIDQPTITIQELADKMQERGKSQPSHPFWKTS
jgi:hypothetical protein